MEQIVFPSLCWLLVSLAPDLCILIRRNVISHLWPLEVYAGSPLSPFDVILVSFDDFLAI